MRYAVFTDIHANLEALESVLARIDELAQEQPIEQIWFLGDLVGYGPNPNECIAKLRERTDVIIAGNHDWAAVGKLDLDDFSAAARISAEWTASELTPDHREFLRNLPERLEIGECTLVHGSPYGPLWEYLTSEVLAERSFQYFNSRFCLVGHTHVPIIFQQPYTLSNEPTEKLDPLSEDTAAMTTVLLTSQDAEQEQSEHAVLEIEQEASIQAALEIEQEASIQVALETHELDTRTAETNHHNGHEQDEAAEIQTAEEQNGTSPDDHDFVAYEILEKTTPEDAIQHAETRLNSEIEELLELLGLSQSMIQVTNETVAVPEGQWEPPQNYRAIVNPGGVGQPRDGDPRAAFLIYDSEQQTFTFYRVEYPFEKTQEKIIQAGLPQYLAQRLSYGR